MLAACFNWPANYSRIFIAKISLQSQNNLFVKNINHDNMNFFW